MHTGQLTVVISLTSLPSNLCAEHFMSVLRHVYCPTSFDTMCKPLLLMLQLQQNAACTGFDSVAVQRCFNILTMSCVAIQALPLVSLCYISCICKIALMSESCFLLYAVIAMSLPFFAGVVGLLGSVGFRPVTKFVPVQMHIVQAHFPSGSPSGLRCRF